MSHILGRSYLPPYLVDQMYQESKSPEMESTLLHINSLMSKNANQQSNEHIATLFDNSFSSPDHNKIIVRNAYYRQELNCPYHFYHDISSYHLVYSRCGNARDLHSLMIHMPHEDYDIIRDPYANDIMEGSDFEMSENTNKNPGMIVYESLYSIRSFYREVLGINNILDYGLAINAVIHFGQNYANAFWNQQALYFGDGDGKYFGPFYNDIDIIAHELSHTFITYTTNFEYSFESGALNESVSDVIAIMVKQYVASKKLGSSVGQDGSHKEAEAPSWLLGENLFIDRINAPALRSMKEPGTAYNIPLQNGGYISDEQVGHMKDYVNKNIMDDNGGVHTNSGIPNKAFYLLATALGGNSWEVAGQIWVQTMYDSTLRANATFKEFAKATINTANQKFGSRVADVTRKSWEGVGLFV